VVYDTVLIETEYALALCTARFVADRNAVVRGSNPRGRISFFDPPMPTLSGKVKASWWAFLEATWPSSRNPKVELA